LTFGERSRVVLRAATSPAPRERVCLGILRAATVAPGRPDAVAGTVLEVLALSLAGAGLEEAPSFARTALVVARGTGWTCDQLATAEAAAVDRLALHLTEPDDGAGWQRLVLASDGGADPVDLRADLADDLLRRADAAAASAEPGSRPASAGPRNDRAIARSATRLPPPVADPSAAAATLAPLLTARVDLCRVGRGAPPPPLDPSPAAPADRPPDALPRSVAPPPGRSPDGALAPAAFWTDATATTGPSTGSVPSPTLALLDPAAWAEEHRLPSTSGAVRGSGAGLTTVLGRPTALGAAPPWSPDVDPWQPTVPLAGERPPGRGDWLAAWPATAPGGAPALWPGWAPPGGVPGEALAEEIADALARLLHDEADLRGIDR
jgi:hypothetical protein